MEITDEQRSKLLAMAAAKGMKGFSGLVQEALEEYLAKSNRENRRIEEAVASMGVLSESEARQLAENCAIIRENWR